ncbi:MAG TPA: hypothetical protein VNI20_03375, partial [Fimbriimonadaceae bacterium]|nr:hypothetical protein [Fimbriimonadaceae bacterium]
MSGQDTDPKTSFEQYYEIERRSRSLARWLTAVCLIAAVATAAAFVTYGTGAITTAEKNETTAVNQYRDAQSTITEQQSKITEQAEMITKLQSQIPHDKTGPSPYDLLLERFNSLNDDYGALKTNYAAATKRLTDCENRGQRLEAMISDYKKRLDDCEKKHKLLESFVNRTWKNDV